MLFHQLRLRKCRSLFVEMLSSSCSGKWFPRLCVVVQISTEFDPVAAATSRVPVTFSKRQAFYLSIHAVGRFLFWISHPVLCSAPPCCEDLLSFNGL